VNLSVSLPADLPCRIMRTKGSVRRQFSLGVLPLLLSRGHGVT